MKALVLAAGFGTRLGPFTDHLPKPLFTITNRPVIDLTIDQLIQAGCTRIFVNTHHLADQIQAHLNQHRARGIIEPVHEPVLLDTGGTIANLKSAFQDDDFLVVNADIVHDLDLSRAVAWHRTQKALATLVLHHDPRFNKILVGKGQEIKGFDAPGQGLAFTGIQVLSPKILEHLPDLTVFSSIDLYRSLCHSGKILAFVPDQISWQDIGTPETYLATSRQWLAGQIFGLTPGRLDPVCITALAGDGSDRRWFRATFQDQSLVLCDHGICIAESDRKRQMAAFLCIGRHLRSRGICVPKILGHDRVSGQVALEDLGSIHLADLAVTLAESDLVRLYQKVITRLVAFSRQGVKGFDPGWTCQTPSYSRQMILDLECRYFLEAFVNGYCKKKVLWEDLEASFTHIADQASEGPQGLMHRDCQSRNIMVRHGEIFFIDFQSARLGPLEYDLASLLIDPYVRLPQRVQDALLFFCITLVKAEAGFDEAAFRHRYAFCCLARNLQMLGAFAFLTQVKQKTWFETHIPAALQGLRNRLKPFAQGPCAPLCQLVNTLEGVP